MKQGTLPFEYLTTQEGILEHLKAYMEREPDTSDPQHYMQLKRGVQHVIAALEAHFEREKT